MSSEEWLQGALFIGGFPWIPLDGELSPMRAENAGQDIFSLKLFFFSVAKDETMVNLEHTIVETCSTP
ncbi:hypothetical protein TRV_05796 [Trichophyton verrucosum HKI 0517]|uniref:Uncharacterized protein n=1 Tax=Trichophyton verrucosum (strain HKI 0517) TaxID=663202 RepID=D4DF51_TRIVH|nr:uncharacterized protein TRV_05796 [Trichophyton verrucosum HKI 0517]EFE39520.1 hypothetical protein TRV_05796 [Trichophyton verrucosum HKI 0517]